MHTVPEIRSLPHLTHSDQELFSNRFSRKFCSQIGSSLSGLCEMNLAGLEGISFSSQPLNPLDHRAVGLIEVEAGTGRRETKNEDKCDKELRSLKRTFAETCDRNPSATLCNTFAKNTIEHSSNYQWQDSLASTVLDKNKTPVFWAGFWPGGEEGIDTREALADFISSVNGFQLADTEWGQAAESKGAKNLENCPWDRKKNWWNAASIMMAKSMALHEVKHITIALHKTWRGNYSFYKTILYQAELVQMGFEMKISSWNPEFEVRSIAVKGAPPHESGCALASAIKYQLELKARRQVTVWCRPCTTLQACGDKELVKKKSLKAKCIKGNCQDGQGTKTWADGKIYQGEWKNGLQDGQGIITHANGSIYDGHWKNNLQHGQGNFTWANHGIYQGAWKNGKKDGQGTFTWGRGDTYLGEYKNDKKDGQGTVTYADGNIYDGLWKKGVKQGQGTFTWADGNIYKGLWRKGVKEGQGTFTWADGRKYQGAWKKDLQHGQGTFTYANGEKYKVWYKEGHLTKKVKK